MKKLLLLFFISFSTLAQKWDPYAYHGPQDVFLGSGLTINNNSFQGLKMKVFTPAFKVKKQYKLMSEAKNSTPLDLVASILSADTQDWIDYNTLGGASNSRKVPKDILESIRDADVEKNYALISSILEFEANGSMYYSVKFAIITENQTKPLLGTYLFKKMGLRWYHTSIPWATNLTILHLSFDDDKLLKIMKGKKIGEQFMDEIIENVHINGVLSLNKLFVIFDSWYAEDNAQKKEYFLDKKSWTF